MEGFWAILSLRDSYWDHNLRVSGLDPQGDSYWDRIGHRSLSTVWKVRAGYGSELLQQ